MPLLSLQNWSLLTYSEHSPNPLLRNKDGPGAITHGRCCGPRGCFCVYGKDTISASSNARGNSPFKQSITSKVVTIGRIFKRQIIGQATLILSLFLRHTRMIASRKHSCTLSTRMYCFLMTFSSPASSQKSSSMVPKRVNLC